MKQTYSKYKKSHVKILKDAGANMFNKKNTPSKKKDNNLITGDWFFMSPDDINVRAIYDMLKENHKMEIWEAANILEIELSEKESIDFEPLKPYFKDKEGDAFLKHNQIQTLFMVTFPPAQFETVKKIMQTILSHCDGFFCADSEDFTPMVHRA